MCVVVTINSKSTFCSPFAAPYFCKFFSIDRKDEGDGRISNILSEENGIKKENSSKKEKRKRTHFLRYSQLL